MQNAFWVSVGLVAFSACGASGSGVAPASTAEVARTAPPPKGGGQAGGKTEVRTPSGKTYSVSLIVDATVAPGSMPTDAKVIAELQGAVVVVDTYNSLPGGMSYCQAGEESFLRVMTTASTTPEETTRVKLSSCRQNIELGSPGLEWQPNPSTLHLQWLSGPWTPGVPAELTLKIGPS